VEKISISPQWKVYGNTTELQKPYDVSVVMPSIGRKEIIKAIENNPTESRKDWLLYLFKFYAKQNGVFDKNHFWQNTNYPIELYSYDVIKQKENYIHLNPVRAGIVANEGDYLFSSASKNSPLKVLNF
jgi:hypothetical protein